MAFSINSVMSNDGPIDLLNIPELITMADVEYFKSRGRFKEAGICEDAIKKANSIMKV